MPQILDMESPQVTPGPAPGGDFFRIDARPEMFGSLVGGAMERAGGAAEKASQEGFSVLDRRAQLENQVGAADNMNWFANAVTHRYVQFGKLEGRAAADNFEQYKGDLDELYSTLKSRATNPVMAAHLATQGRELMARYYSYGAHWADQQDRAFGDKTTGDLAANYGNTAAIAGTHGDQGGMVRDFDRSDSVIGDRLRLKGYDSESISAEIARNRGRNVKTVAETLLRQGHIDEAQTVLDAQRDRMDAASVLAVETAIHGPRERRIGQLAGSAALSESQATAARNVAPSVIGAWRDAGMSGNGIAGVLHNIKEESGFNSALRHPDQPNWGGEAHFAHGLYQEGGAEWNRYQSWLAANAPGHNWRDPLLQSQFAAWNLKTNYPDTWARMNAAPTPEAAAAVYAREYLKPAAVYLQSRLGAIRSKGVAPLESYGAQGSAGAVQPAVQTQGAPAATAAPSAAPLPIKSDAYRRVLDDPNLTEEQRQHALTYIDHTIRAQEIADNQNAKTQREASDQAAGGYVTEIGDMLHSPNPDWVAFSGKINHDPNLEWRTKQALMEHVRKLSGEEQAIGFGPGYLAARRGLFSSPSDPDHIADFGSLMTRDDITPAGLRDLNERLRFARADVDRGAVERRINSFLAYGKSKLSFEQDMGSVKLRDPDGEGIFNAEFAPSFMKQASALAAEAQKSGDQSKLDAFLSKENVDKLIRSYRDPRDMERKRLAASGDAEEPLPATPEGVNPAGWVPIVRSPAPSASGKVMPMAAWAIIIDRLRADPTSKNKADFDAQFGKAGFKADEILERLKPSANEEAPPAAEAAPAAPSLLERARGAVSGFIESERQKTAAFYAPAGPATSPASSDRDRQLADLDRQQKEAEALPEGKERRQRLARIEANRAFYNADIAKLPQ